MFWNLSVMRMLKLTVKLHIFFNWVVFNKYKIYQQEKKNDECNITDNRLTEITKYNYIKSIYTRVNSSWNVIVFCIIKF